MKTNNPKASKPKGATPSLIGSTLGTPRECTVGRLSKCNRCDGELTKGTDCHEIPQLGGTFANYKRYCDTCYASILQKTKEVLEGLIETSKAA